ncbi:MAG: hypothetical protein AAFQ63_04245 [Cyanobacteria bacterium J06621_11]
MSVSSKSASQSDSSFTAHPSAVQSTDVQSTESAGMPVVRDVMFNRSPEQADVNRRFEMPLFPGYQKRTTAVPVALKPSSSPDRYRDTDTSYSDALNVETLSIETLRRQQAELAQHSQEQSLRSHSEIQGLQQQLLDQAAHHQAELQEMKKVWQRQLTDLSQSSSAPSSTQQSFVSPRSVDSARSANAVMPDGARTSQPSASKTHKKNKLSHIPTTYQVPRRTQVRWPDRFLSAVPTFLWLVFLGMALSILCAIALSSGGFAPIGLVTNLGLSMQSVIPGLFIISVVSLGVTAVWDTFR